MSGKVQLIKEEIEKEMSLLDRTNEYDIGRLDELNHLVLFIDSLPEESASEDLEEYAKKLAKGAALDKHNLIWMCKKGAEWQKQQMKEALQTEYEKGRFDMREEMMKTLVEGEIVKDIHNQLKVTSEPLNDTFGKFGDRLKIIIVKEEQQ